LGEHPVGLRGDRTRDQASIHGAFREEPRQPQSSRFCRARS